MPIYDYLCQSCGPFEARRPMAQFQEPVACPTCQASAPRMVTAVQLNLMPKNNRIAHTRNEKNAHEPRITHSHGSSHVSHDKGCTHQHNHCHHHKHTQHTGSRPWQVGH